MDTFPLKCWLQFSSILNASLAPEFLGQKFPLISVKPLKRSLEGLFSPLPPAGSQKEGSENSPHTSALLLLTFTLRDILGWIYGIPLVACVGGAFPCPVSGGSSVTTRSLPPFTSLLLQLYPILQTHLQEILVKTFVFPSVETVSFFFSLREANPEFSKLIVQLYSQTFNRRFVITYVLDIGYAQETKLE